MKTFNIRDVGTKGLNSDIAPWDLPEAFITYGKNFRVYTNYFQTAGGYQDWQTVPNSINPGFLMFVGDSDNPFWVVCGRSAIQSFNGATWFDITPAGFSPLVAGAELLWTGCLLGRIPVFNNFLSYPFYWSPPEGAQALQLLPWDASNTWEDVGIRAKVIRSHKNFLFALNLQEGATEYPNTYRWSHPADINGLPFSWDETDPSSIAGRASIGGNYGPIVDGLTLRDTFAIYSESGINILTYTGDEFVWNRRALSSTVGLISSNALAEVKGRHFLMVDGDIVMNDGTTINSIVHSRIQRTFNARINPDYYFRSFAVRNNVDKEVWFCVPHEDSEYPNVAYVYNWKEDSWSIRDLPADTTFAAYGPKTTPMQTWDTWAGTWDQQVSPWGNTQKTPFDDTVIGIDISDNMRIIDPSGARDSGDLQTILERTDIPINGLENVTTIVKAYPHISGTSEVEIEFGSQKVAGGPVSWKAPVTFRPGVDRKIDIRSTGQLHSWRISSNIQGNWAFSGMDLEYEDAGKR